MNDLLLSEYYEFKKRQNFINFKLTDRENDVVFLITKGYKNRKIGEVLYISETTVKKHVYNIFNKIGISSRFELLCKLNSTLSHSYIERAC
jgi:DNA-binding NarL/FixJ family response regulator